MNNYQFDQLVPSAQEVTNLHQGKVSYISHTMESPVSNLARRSPCSCHPWEQNQPKILHSLLAFHQQQDVILNHNRDGAGSVCSSPRDSRSPASSSCTDGWRTPSPAASRGSHSPYSNPSSPPSHSPSPVPGSSLIESKLYNMLRGPSTAYSYPSASPSATVVRDPYPNLREATPPVTIVREHTPTGTIMREHHTPVTMLRENHYPTAAPTTTTVIRDQQFAPRVPSASMVREHYQPLNLKKRQYHCTQPQEEGPIDLSCKKPRTIVIEPRDITSSPFNGAYSDSESSQPPSPMHPPVIPSSTGQDNGPQSILKSILCRRTMCEPTDAQETKKEYCSQNSIVALAKKNLFPVSARVSDWLVKLVHFARSLPEFANLPHNDKVTLILHSWGRLLLLYMAETNFQFVVTPKGSSETVEPGCKDSNTTSDPSIPTMKAVEALQAFIKKCQTLNIDSREFCFLRMLALFHSESGVESLQYIDAINSCIRQSLQDHIRTTRPTDKLRYSQLLMCLPSLYSVNTKMMEKLFCKHISNSTDMEVLLKELLQKV